MTRFSPSVKDSLRVIPVYQQRFYLHQWRDDPIGSEIICGQHASVFYNAQLMVTSEIQNLHKGSPKLSFPNIKLDSKSN